MTRRPFIHRWMALLSLCAFTLGQAWLCPSAVWCHDAATGRAHLEVACGGQDCCHASLPGADDSTDVLADGVGASLHDGDGCVDVAVVQMAIRSEHTSACGLETLTPCVLPPTLACVPRTLDGVDRACVIQPSEVLRPPDPLALIEFVILVV